VRSADRIVLRGFWVWNIVAWLVSFTFLMVGASELAYGSSTWEKAFYLPFFVGGLYATVRVTFRRLVVTSTGVVYHGLLSNRTISWDTVESARVVETDGTFATAYAPALILLDGTEEQFSSLAGYARARNLESSRMARQARVLDAWRRGQSPGPAGNPGAAR
jgi:hypothetical protein